MNFKKSKQLGSKNKMTISHLHLNNFPGEGGSRPSAALGGVPCSPVLEGAEGPCDPQDYIYLI